MTTIETFLAGYPAPVRELTGAARLLLRRALPGARETLDAAARLIGYGYAPGYKGTVCVLLLSRGGVKIGFFRGAELPDPNGLLEGSGKVHRHIPLRTNADLKQAGIGPLLKAALVAWRVRNE